MPNAITNLKLVVTNGCAQCPARSQKYVLIFSETLVPADKVKHPMLPRDDLDADVFVKQTENRNVDTARGQKTSSGQII